MRMNTSNNYESCVWFCFLTGPCLQPNFQLHTKWNKTRILNLWNGWSLNKWALHVNGHCLRDPFKCAPLIPASIQLILLSQSTCKYLSLWGGCFSAQGFRKVFMLLLQMADDGWQTGLPQEEEGERGFCCGLLPCCMGWGRRQAPWA